MATATSVDLCSTHFSLDLNRVAIEGCVFQSQFDFSRVVGLRPVTRALPLECASHQLVYSFSSYFQLGFKNLDMKTGSNQKHIAFHLDSKT